MDEEYRIPYQSTYLDAVRLDRAEKCEVVKVTFLRKDPETEVFGGREAYFTVDGNFIGVTMKL